MRAFYVNHNKIGIGNDNNFYLLVYFIHYVSVIGLILVIYTQVNSVCLKLFIINRFWQLRYKKSLELLLRFDTNTL